ncbi:MAG: hypothetical protein E5X48_30880 [Mesorhizobium sp.]|nr:MAG: hypothetical protein E5X48_30880 [Mesorhizobium sp.]
MEDPPRRQFLALSDLRRRWRSFAPPSVLPDISPTRGEIGRHNDLRQRQRSIMPGSPLPALPVSPSPPPPAPTGRTDGHDRRPRPD